ncbi:MAG: RluA family pseudouridine synthase [Isosphaerales bacterium]
MNLDVLYEDNHCLAVNKPAGLLSQGGDSGEPSLVEAVTAYLKTRYAKPGNVYVGLLHRLDRPTSGVVLLARTSKAAGRLSAQFRAGTISKVYWAIVEGRPHEAAGEWIDVLEKDSRRNRGGVVPEGSIAGKEARVAFRIMETWGRYTKLELRPATGRSHQLRIQLASRRLPILGDRKYGARSRLNALDGGFRIALHARRLTFMHPTRRESISVDAPVPGDWPTLSPGRSEPGCDSSKPAAGSGP